MRSAPRWSLLLAIGIGVACGDDAQRDSKPDEKEQAEPTPADEPVAADEPVVDPTPVAGTVLVDAGHKAQQVLRVSPVVGSAQRLVVTARVNVRRGAAPAELAPRVRLELDTTVTSDGGDHWRRELEIVSADVLMEKGVAPEAREAMATRVAALVGQKGSVGLAADGRSTDYTLAVDPGADAELAGVLAGVRLALTEHLVALPAEPVGDGAVWEVTRRANVHGIEAWRRDRYGLRKRDGDQIEVRADVTFPPGELAGQPAGFEPLSELTSLQGKGEVEARIDLADASPIETHVTLELAFTGRDAAGADVGAKLGVDVTIDEDYLQQRDPRVVLRGTFSQGGLVIGKVEPKTRVWFDKKRIRVSPEGDFLLGFEREHHHRARLAFAFPGQPVERHVVHVAQREYEPERIDGLPPEMVDLDGATRKQLARSRRQVEKVRSKKTRETDFTEGFSWPVKGRITSTYGRPRVLNGEPRGIHWGVDIAAPVGKKVRAPAPGVVVLAQQSVPLSGNLLIIDHGHGLSSSFLHLRKFKVAVGDEVKKGQIIAEAGKSGRATGPHLDWRMNLGDVRVDPQLIVGK